MFFIKLVAAAILLVLESSGILVLFVELILFGLVVVQGKLKGSEIFLFLLTSGLLVGCAESFLSRGDLLLFSVIWSINFSLESLHAVLFFREDNIFCFDTESISSFLLLLFAFLDLFQNRSWVIGGPSFGKPMLSYLFLIFESEICHNDRSGWILALLIFNLYVRNI